MPGKQKPPPKPQPKTNGKKKNRQRRRNKAVKRDPMEHGGNPMLHQKHFTALLGTLATNANYAKAMVLPGESRALRWLASTADTPTNVFRYTYSHPDVVVPKPADSKPVNMGAELLDGSVFILSRQPSRPMGYRSTTEIQMLCSWPDQGSAANTPGRPLLTTNIYHPMFPSNASAVNYRKMVFGTSRETFPGFDFTPYVLTKQGGDTGRAHIGVDTTHRYIWLTAASPNTTQQGSKLSISFTCGYDVTMATAPASEQPGLAEESQTPAPQVIKVVKVQATFQIQRWGDDQSSTSRNVFTVEATAFQDEATSKPYVLTASVDWVPFYTGYHRIDCIGMEVAHEFTKPLAVYGARFGCIITHPAGTIDFTTVPEMVNRQDIYQSARVPAAAFLFSNRTPPYYAAGTIRAVRFGNEQMMRDCFDNQTILAGGVGGSDSSFNARSAQKPNGYNDNLRHGFYHWMRTTQDDMVFKDYINEYSTPIYRLDHNTAVTVVQFTGTDVAQNILTPFFTMHVEAEISDCQSYGEQWPPRMTTLQLENVLIQTSTWEIFHENPTHVLEYLKKIAGASWKGFKWASPYLMKAAAMASAGATPAGVAAGIARMALGM